MRDTLTNILALTRDLRFFANGKLLEIGFCKSKSEVLLLNLLGFKPLCRTCNLGNNSIETNGIERSSYMRTIRASS